MPPPLLERREGLHPFVGRRVAVRAVAFRGASRLERGRRVATTLLGFVAVGGDRVAHHVWLEGLDLLAAELCLPGDVVDFTAEVTCYPGWDGAAGRAVTKYGLADPREVVSRGPAVLAALVAEMVGVWRWEAVADAVADAAP